MGNSGLSIPLSGEILPVVKDANAESAGGRAEHIADAEFEVIGAEPVATACNMQNLARGGPVRPADAELSMLRKGGEKAQQEHGGIALYLGGLVIALMAFWVSGGHVLFNGMTKAAMPTPGNGIRIGEVSTSTVRINGRMVLLVNGSVFNDSAEGVMVPPIRITVTTKSGGIERFQLGSHEQLLVPWRSMPFSIRLDAPAAGVGSVLVELTWKDSR